MQSETVVGLLEEEEEERKSVRSGNSKWCRKEETGFARVGSLGTVTQEGRVSQQQPPLVVLWEDNAFQRVPTSLIRVRVRTRQTEKNLLWKKKHTHSSRSACQRVSPLNQVNPSCFLSVNSFKVYRFPRVHRASSR